VLDNAGRSSSLAASMPRAVELLQGQIDTVAANGVPFCIGCHRVAFLRAEGAQVRTQCRPDRGRGRCPLDPGAHGLGQASVVCSFLGFP
jgi:hypothetical protein